MTTTYLVFGDSSNFAHLLRESGTFGVQSRSVTARTHWDTRSMARPEARCRPLRPTWTQPMAVLANSHPVWKPCLGCSGSRELPWRSRQQHTGVGPRPAWLPGQRQDCTVERIRPHRRISGCRLGPPFGNGRMAQLAALDQAAGRVSQRLRFGLNPSEVRPEPEALSRLSHEGCMPQRPLSPAGQNSATTSGIIHLVPLAALSKKLGRAGRGP